MSKKPPRPCSLGGFFIGSWLSCAVLTVALIAALLSPTAVAGGLEAKSSREPLPARQVEQPITIPKGWTDLAAAVSVEQSAGEPHWVDQWTVRRGVLPRHELSLSWSQMQPGLGWRWSLFRKEPPSMGLAWEASWSGPAEIRGGLAFRRQIGGLRLTARAGGLHRYEVGESASRSSLEALLQAGLLVFVAEPTIDVGTMEMQSDLALRGTVQWTRGFDTSVLLGFPLAGDPSGRTLGALIGARF